MFYMSYYNWLSAIVRIGMLLLVVLSPIFLFLARCSPWPTSDCGSHWGTPVYPVDLDGPWSPCGKKKNVDVVDPLVMSK